MNGEVNGTMEDPVGNSSPSSPDKSVEQTDAEPVEAMNSPDQEAEENENSNHCEAKPAFDSSDSNGQPNNTEFYGDSVEKVMSNATVEEPSQDSSNSNFMENHNGDSNISIESNSDMKTENTSDHPNDNIADKQAKNEAEYLNKHCPKNSLLENIDEAESEEFSNDEIEGSEGEPRAEDTVSINSDSDDEDENNTHKNHTNTKSKNDNILILDSSKTKSHNGKEDNSHTPVVHDVESDHDDCVTVTPTSCKQPIKNTSENKMQLRRSSRAIKRKRYTDDLENGDESEMEVTITNPVIKRSRPIIINDTKTLVEMAARQMKSHKKEPTVVIIDSNTRMSDRIPIINKKPVLSSSAQSLYQSIMARGTTVTPVSSKNSTATQSSQTPQPAILPSLTDDMFVVEAPSFIVPYVYEKPSLKPFREFVDILGKELDEQRVKEEKELSEKKKDVQDTEKTDKSQSEKKHLEEFPESDDETESEKKELEEKKKKKSEKKEQRKQKNDDDDASWDGESSADSDDDIISDEDEKTIVLKDKIDSIEEIKDVTDMTVDKVCSGKSDNYFDCSLGKFFINIGLNLVQEYVQTDLYKQQNRKLYREKKTGQNTKARELSIALLMKNLELSKENNAPYKFTQLKCEFCTFKTESKMIMAHHLETPHMKNNVYKCNFCEFEIRSPHDILYHMEAEHNVRGKLERAPAYHQCANCPFEDNGKGKLARHLIACAKKFKPETNLAPPVEWEPPAKIPKISRARNNNVVGSYQNNMFRSQVGNNLNRPLNMANLIGNAGFRARGRSPLAVAPRAPPVHGVPIVRAPTMVRHNTPVLMSNYPVNNLNKKPGHQPSISITPLPRQPQPPPQPTPQSKSTFVICEICDGYIKDLEQLRNHMQWIHKVKIHPKMIYNRPPLNCQKCQFRFFTDQGLERHLLGSHGLVTSSMQEAANKGKDAGRCPVCGRVYQWKLLNHVARDHNMTLKPAHLSYKCTVCTATFGMYKQFENHVYSAHSVVAKRVMDKSKGNPASTAKSNESLLKPLKINDEITIIPQPAKAAGSASAKDK